MLAPLPYVTIILLFYSTAPPEISTLSLHDALPVTGSSARGRARRPSEGGAARGSRDRRAAGARGGTGRRRSARDACRRAAGWHAPSPARTRPPPRPSSTAGGSGRPPGFGRRA